MQEYQYKTRIYHMMIPMVSRFGCVVILALYLSALLLIASLTVGIFRSLMSAFVTYQGAFTNVLGILAYIIPILFIWLIAAALHSGIP